MAQSGDEEYDLIEHLQQIPHSNALGLNLISHSEDNCELRLDWAEHLVGDPDSGVIHGGAVTALLDNAAGLVARPKNMPRENAAIATLDLRIDYLAAAEPKQAIIASAHCYKRTRNVAFVRANAYHQDPEEPIASCTATFMLGTRNTAFSAT